jgi:PAS domain-containing protein
VPFLTTALADVGMFAEEFMPNTDSGDGAGEKRGGHDGTMEFRRQKTLLKTGALQDAIFNSANFSSIATDEKGVIQIFNVGAERMLGYLRPHGG